MATGPPIASSAWCSEPCSKPRPQDLGVGGRKGGILQREGHPVREADPHHAHDVLAGIQREVALLLGPGAVQATRQQAGAGVEAASLHLLGEGQEHPGAAVHRPAGDERALASATVDQAGVAQLLQRLASRHAADPEGGAQAGLARQRVAGAAPLHQVAEVALDLAVPSLGRSLVVR